MSKTPPPKLRSGWTTGACATAAAKAAVRALLGEGFPDSVTITLPRGETPAFRIAGTASGPGWAEAAVIKDAGDDPDVTHLATIRTRVASAPPGAGIRFHAGTGVGTVTKPGLPIPPGEPAINPVPRQMLKGVVMEAAAAYDTPADFDITISAGVVIWDIQKAGAAYEAGLERGDVIISLDANMIDSRSEFEALLRTNRSTA